jgi:hypothetical protein
MGNEVGNTIGPCKTDQIPIWSTAKLFMPSCAGGREEDGKEGEEGGWGWGVGG